MTEMQQRHSSNEITPEDISRYKAPDGGWGWVVCFACFVTHLFIDGVSYSFGIVFAELLDYYKGTNAETAWIISLSTSMCFLSGPVVSALTTQFGCRTIATAGTMVSSISLILSMYAPNLYFLYFSHGILFGFGHSMMYLPAIVCVSEYFEERRALATGLGVCGSGVGTFIFSPLTAMLIETYAWRGTILIQAGLILNCLACSLVYRPLERKEDRTKCEGEDSTRTDENDKRARSDQTPLGALDKAVPETRTDPDCERATSESRPPGKRSRSNICRNCWVTMYNSFRVTFSPVQFRNKAFTIFAISTFVCSLGYYIPYVYLPVRSHDAGIDEPRAAWILSTVGISSAVGRVVSGFISDKKWVNRLYLFSTALVICGNGTSLGPFLGSFARLLIYAIVFGMFSGVTVSLTSVLITDIVGIKQLSRAFGMINFIAGFGGLVGPPLGGWLYDITGNYNASFVAAGSFIAFSGAMLYVVPLIDREWNNRKFRQNKKRKITNESNDFVLSNSRQDNMIT